MKLRTFNLFFVLAIASCTASYAGDTKPKPANDLGKAASNAATELGHQADRAEHAITSSVKNMNKGANEKPNNKPDAAGNNLQKNASDAMSALGHQADRAEHAITSSVKSAPAKTSKGTNDFGKGASKVMNSLGDQADQGRACNHFFGKQHGKGQR